MTRAPSEAELTSALADAVRAAFRDWQRQHADHRPYYITHTTDGAATAPCLSLWSHEALAAVVQAHGGDALAARDLKWSYADSPFFDVGPRWLDPVRQLFYARPQPAPGDTTGWDRERHLRLRVMETAMARLDAEGLFGRGAARLAAVVLVEQMPPDHSNTARARRLNPPAALVDWLAEAAEPAGDGGDAG